MKKCSKCPQLKELYEFSKSNRQKDKLQVFCKICMKTYLKNRRINNPEKTKVYEFNNKNFLKNSRQNYYLKNKDRILQQSKKFLDKNPDYNKNYYEKNKEKRHLYIKNRKIIDINFKIKYNFQARTRIALKNNQKSGKTIDLLGCSIEELKLHLEKSFKNGMNWANYGKIWHIDHILPCASFDLKNPINQQKCFHFSNLQALFAEENLKKSDKLNYFSNLS